ncbi:MAG: hypothetical protein ACI8S6_003353 [Myxococcota bacterium]|jgi:hypothetical protein
MHSNEDIVSFYVAAFGPLHNPDPAWLADVVTWCRKVLEAETLQEAARIMAAWASDGDLAAAHQSAARLRQAAFPDDEAGPPKPAPPSDEQLRRWLQATTRPGWKWWSHHRLPVYIEHGSSWRRVFADGELIRAWSAASRRICPDLSDPAVRGWGEDCLSSGSDPR